MIGGECRLGDDSDSDHNYIQRVIPGTHKISDSNSRNDDKEQRTVTCVDEQGVRLGGVSTKFVWEVINTILHYWKNVVVSTAHSF
jgi:hypothetical protein